jgi:hypothetical protein
MALSASGLYRMSAEQLRAEFSERGLGCSGPVRVLRSRLDDLLKADQMDQKGEQQDIQASGVAPMLNPGSEVGPQGDSGFSSSQVLGDLLRHVKPLVSEEPEEILRFFVKISEIYELGLVDDRVFITRILSFVPGGLLQFLGACLREESSWAASKAQLLDKYFPHFVRERLIRDLIVFKFRGEGQSMRAYFDQVFQAANILQYTYEATEQLVERVVMNLHPQVLSQAALFDKPRSRKDLYRLVGLIEERILVPKERDWLGPEVTRGGGNGSGCGGRPRNDRDDTRAPARGPIRCWGCGQQGHVRRSCPEQNVRSGNV